MLEKKILALLREHPEGLSAIAVLDALVLPDLQSLIEIERKCSPVQAAIRRLMERGDIRVNENLSLQLSA